MTKKARKYVTFGSRGYQWREKTRAGECAGATYGAKNNQTAGLFVLFKLGLFPIFFPAQRGFSPGHFYPKWLTGFLKTSRSN